jgi:hypothetical protein
MARPRAAVVRKLAIIAEAPTRPAKVNAVPATAAAPTLTPVEIAAAAIRAIMNYLPRYLE